MDKDCYALIAYGEFEGTIYEFIKIKDSEKEKFKKYCLDSQKICGSYVESIELLCWAYDIEIYNPDSHDICIYSIHDHQERIKECLNRLDEMKEKHYLYRHNKRDYFLKLLEYEWE